MTATFVDTIAPERFARYLAWSQGNVGLAHRLYARNVALAEAFYTPLHTLEIVLRNRVDDAMRSAFSDVWFDDPAVISFYPMQRKVQEARQKLSSLGPRLTRGHVVAELSFGFWTSMFNRQQHRHWRHLQPIFVGARGLQRRSVSGQLDDVRTARNRIAHYEPIVHLDLMALYREVDTLTTWLSPDAAAWTAAHSRFLSLCPPGRLVINNAIDPTLAQTL